MTKRYYKKRYYNISSSQKEKEAKALILVIFALFAGAFGFYANVIKPNLDKIILFLEIFIPILFLIIGLIIFYVYKKRKKVEQERIESIPNFLLELENKIKIFKPLKNYNKEESYQIELAGFLKSTYKNLNIEVSKNYTRPDIVVDDIAIEIKGPTTMNELKTIPHKIMTYLKEREYLFIVLFNIEITQDKEKSKEIYDNWKKNIFETFENKKDKIFFIEI